MVRVLTYDLGQVGENLCSVTDSVILGMPPSLFVPQFPICTIQITALPCFTGESENKYTEEREVLRYHSNWGPAKYPK